MKWLAEIGKRSTNQALSRMSPQRRYPILVACLQTVLAEQTDVAVEAVAVCLQSIKGRANHDLEDFRKRHAKATNEMVHYFGIMGRLTVNESIPNHDLRARIFAAIPRADLEAALQEQPLVSRPLDDNAHDFFTDRYTYLHRFAPQYLATLRFHAHPEATAIVDAVALLRRYKRRLPATAPTTFIDAGWRPQVLAPTGAIHRDAYALCTMTALSAAVKAGNIWVDHSQQYAEPASYLMPAKQWRQHREEICTLLQTATEGRQQLQMRQADLESLLTQVDAALPTASVRIDAGELVISPLAAELVPPRVARVQATIEDAYPLVELAELLIEVDEQVQFTEALTHAGGGTSHLAPTDLKRHLYAAIMAQACNYGLVRMAQMANLSYETLVWVNQWYLREETLKAANARIVNAHHRLPFSRHWGTGALSSSDGQRFPIMGQARNARAQSRYFPKTRKGVQQYTWTSDQLSQYGTKVTAVTVRDATYVLDEILDNVTELPIVEHTTDTSGATDILFCLFDLLGLRFSPRLKDLASRQIYQMGERHRFATLDPILKGSVNLNRILPHYEELLHIVGSLKYGYATASLLITKLQANVRQNALAKAAQEYGRLISSIHILRMLYEEEDRRRIHHQLNKGEHIHNLRQFIHCANEGQIRQKQVEEQLNGALCLTIMTNAIIYWNTPYLEEAITQLRHQGYAVQDEDIAHLYPTHFAHINPHGTVAFHVRDTTEPPRPRRPLRAVPPPPPTPRSRGRPPATAD